MTDFIIGDVHGCLDTLRLLCDQLQLSQGDRVYFLGDLVGKNNDDWGVLRFLEEIPAPQVILGNHDLHFLRVHHQKWSEGVLSDHQMTSYQRLQAGALAKWDPNSDTLMVHAGIWPGWSLATTLSYAAEVEAILGDPVLCKQYFAVFYGDENEWRQDLIGWKRVRCLVNVFTRMRMINQQAQMDFSFTGPVEPQGGTKKTDYPPDDLMPWYSTRSEWPCQQIVFGHWAMLHGETGRKDVINCDGGCAYGGQLIGMRLDTGERYMANCIDPV